MNCDSQKLAPVPLRNAAFMIDGTEEIAEVVLPVEGDGKCYERGSCHNSGSNNDKSRNYSSGGVICGIGGVGGGNQGSYLRGGGSVGGGSVGGGSYQQQQYSDSEFGAGNTGDKNEDIPVEASGDSCPKNIENARDVLQNSIHIAVGKMKSSENITQEVVAEKQEKSSFLMESLNAADSTSGMLPRMPLAFSTPNSAAVPCGPREKIDIDKSNVEVAQNLYMSSTNFHFLSDEDVDIDEDEDSFVLLKETEG